MEVRVVGPLEVAEAGHALPLREFRRRLVLGVLLIRPNRTGSADWLVDAVWGEDPPRTARKTLQVYISRLGSLLGSDVIEAASTGYSLRLGSNELDATRFEDLADEGCRADAIRWKETSRLGSLWTRHCRSPSCRHRPQ